MSDSVPGERSFTYGWAVRGLAVWPGTLTTLVFAQCVAGAVTAGLLAYALRVCFGVRAWVAVGVAVASCFDPLQVLHERLVLTEAFAQLVFVAHGVAALRYLRTTEWANLLAIAGTGIVLVSLRSVYLPVVLLDAVAVPALAVLRVGEVVAERRDAHLGQSVGDRLQRGVPMFVPAPRP